MKKSLLLPPFDRFPPQFADVNGHRTGFIRHGSGPPAVLLHGYAGSIWNWERQIEPLGRRFTLYIPDLIGQGLSAKPRAAYTPAFHTEWLKGFLDAIGAPRAALVGHSMGAGLACAMALSHPSRVDRLVLISGFPKGLLDYIATSHLRRLYEWKSGILFGLGYRLLGRGAFRKLLGGLVWDRSLVTQDVVERAYRLCKDCGKSRPLWSALSNLDLWETDYAARLHTIAAPTLIIWGSDDRFVPLAAGQALHRLIPQSRLSILAQAGHLPMWERPEEVNRLIIDFLS